MTCATTALRYLMINDNLNYVSLNSNISNFKTKYHFFIITSTFFNHLQHLNAHEYTFPHNKTN